MSKKNKKKSVKKKTSQQKSKHNQQTKSISSTSSSNPLQIMTNWFVVLVAIIPFLFSKVAMDPVVSVRYMFISSFCILFVIYFFGIKKTPISSSIPNLVKCVFYLGLGFGLWSGITILFAQNIQASYFPVARHLLNIGLLFICMVAVIRENSHLIRLTRMLVIVSLIQSFIGIVQHYGLGFESIPGTVHAKPYGLHANRNLFGSGQTFLIPFILYTWHKGSEFWKKLSTLALGTTIISIFLSQTRSAWLASVVLFLIIIPAIVFLLKGISVTTRKRWMQGSIKGILGTVLLLAIIVITGSGSFSNEIANRAKSLVGATENNGSATQVMKDGSTAMTSVNERLIIWSQSIAMLKDNPVFGVGPGNWPVAIPAYGSEGLVAASGKSVRVRPHNVYLQVADETGIPGILLYLSMWFLMAICGLKVILSTSNEDAKILAILMIGGLAAFAIDMVFSFPTDRIVHSLYIFLFGGILLGLYSTTSTEENNKLNPIPLWLTGSLLTIFTFNCILGYAKYHFEIHMKRANAYRIKGNFKQTLHEVELSKTALVSLDPIGNPRELHSSDAYKGLKQYDKALEEIQKALQYHPNNASIYNNFGTIYTETNQFEKAIEMYNKALEITPNHDIALKNLAMNYINVRDYTKSLDILNRIDIRNSEYLQNVKRAVELEINKVTE